MEKKLIELVAKNPFFYDKTCGTYKDIPAKEKKWREIDAILKLPRNSAKKRWRTLRDSHIRERKRQSSKSPNKKVTWKFAKHMKFFDEYLERSYKLKTEPIYEETESLDESSNTATATIDLPNGQTQNVDLLRDIESVYTEEYLPESEVESSNTKYKDNTITYLSSKSAADTSTGEASNTTHVASRNRKKRRSKDDSLQKTAYKSMIELLNLAKRSFEKDTPVRAFFYGVVSQIEAENISLARFATLQRRVLNVVHEELGIHRRGDYG